KRIALTARGRGSRCGPQRLRSPPSREDRSELMRSWRNALVAATSLLAGAGVATGQTWQSLTNQPAFSAGAMLLLTDGTVLVHAEQNDSRNWYKLTPDVNGSYLNGTWTQVASLPAGYAPLYFSSAVLPDGRVIIEGGE